MTPVTNETYLGFDLSTQKLKAVQLNSNLGIIVNAEVKFDTDLPEFETNGGVNVGTEKDEYYAQPVMWVQAVDLILNRLVVQGANLSTVVAIGGSAQQHGSIYWSREGIETLKNLDSDKFLHHQINKNAFTMTATPIWMDGTTESQCIEMENSVGGREKMVTITGSKCYHRFTGPQIRKVYQTRPNVYENTERISLISSFLASIFIGKIAPIDYSDASGMNLFDIKNKCWSKSCLNACAPELETRLDYPVNTCSIVGHIGSFFVQRYGFPSTCLVSAFTGDNPSALTGMLVSQDWLAISLGTSDTIMMGIDEPPNLEEGHVLCHPTDEDRFMGLLCFRNGSLVRDVIKRVEANNNWDHFSELLNLSPRGNNGNLALHFHSLEIIPKAKGTLRWNQSHSSESPDGKLGVKKFSSPQIEVRALIEGQMLHRKVIAEEMGFHFGEHTKILVTGGASVNKSILQVMADVFNAPVYTQKKSEAALLGAAYRAKYCHYLYKLGTCNCLTNGTSTTNGKVSNGGNSKLKLDGSNPENYHNFILRFLPNVLQRVCDPTEGSLKIYSPMFDRYKDMAKILEDATN